MFDLLVAYILTVIGLTAGQLNFGTTSLPQCQNDAACAPPSVCIDNICAQGASCKSNADCDDPRFECNRQFCVPKHKWRPDKLMTCKTDSSCISPATCVDNFCIVTKPCQNDYDCGSSQIRCVQNICVVFQPVTLLKPRVGSNPSYPGQIPDVIPPPPPQPIFDCVNGACPEGYTCLAGSCHAKNCRVDSDCGGYGNGFICIKDVCLQITHQFINLKTYLI
ncbi:unnamed protein product [Cylicocyclus nassatus]|uniref:Uncharacterized protein n=1 Tax=Cylicocyclus nassatus TaxID=53992 RepID=A0AA36GPV5_CYLNA|nr:unnamed protein product [Cylicocyclus nassatus]